MNRIELYLNDNPIPIVYQTQQSNSWHLAHIMRRLKADYVKEGDSYTFYKILKSKIK